jgi:chloramphenicol-sensitive protein RarD
MVAHRAIWTAVFGIVLLVALRRLQHLRAIGNRPRLVGTLLLSGVCISSNWIVFLWAITHERMLEASMGYFINPLLSVMLGVVLLRERLRPGQIAAIALASSGVVYLVIQYGSIPWIAMFLPCTFAMYGFIRKHTPVDSLSGLTVETLFMLPVALAYVFWLAGRGESHFGPGAGIDSVYLLGVGVITLVPLVMFASAARRVRLATLGILQYIAPTLTFMLGVFAYHETFDQVKLVAFCCIWLSLFIYTLEGVRFSRVGAPRAPAGTLAE